MNTIDITILEDGTIVAKTTDIDMGNHISADSLLEQMETLLGGPATRIKNPEKHKHQHTTHNAHAH